jgi:hypothetical protein
MSNWLNLLQKPDNLAEVGSVEIWFTKIAQELLNNSQLKVGDESYRILEIEFYCFSEEHPDVFTHQDQLQKECGRWYFHRVSGEYKNGSFKGMDLTFGNGTMRGGILIRSMESSDSILTCGPCLCVDNLLLKTNSKDVPSLDLAIDSRVAWHPDNPLRLEVAPTQSRQNQLFRSGRVGLSLKKAKSSPEMPWYILRPYRYLTQPKKVSKGKAYLVLSLYAQGVSIEEINQITGSPKLTIQKYIADFELGRQEKDFSIYFSIELNPKELCKLHGTWHELARIK